MSDNFPATQEKLTVRKMLSKDWSASKSFYKGLWGHRDFSYNIISLLIRISQNMQQSQLCEFQEEKQQETLWPWYEEIMNYPDNRIDFATDEAWERYPMEVRERLILGLDTMRHDILTKHPKKKTVWVKNHSRINQRLDNAISLEAKKLKKLMD